MGIEQFYAVLALSTLILILNIQVPGCSYIIIMVNHL